MVMAFLKRFVIVIGMLAFIGTTGSTYAAELGAAPMASRRERVVELGPNCQRLQRCDGDICRMKTICWRGCPDRYSCAPLYGAYGPYGGSGYWGAYSYGQLLPY